MEAIIQSDLENKLQNHLRNCENNEKTSENIPVLDMGDRPNTFEPNRAESMQMFIIPKS